MPPITAYSDRIRLSLRQLQKESISEVELSEAVQLSRALITAYLGSMRSSLAGLCLQQGLTITDLSYDCIAEAFARDADSSFRMINNFIASLDGELDSVPDRDLALAYKSFLHRIVEAQLARLFAQSDPSGARVLRNIRDAVKLSARFVIKKDFRGNVLYPRSIDPCEHLDPYPADELEHLIAQSANPRQTIPQILECLHELLSNQTNYRRTIILTDLALIVKNVYQSDFSPETSAEQSLSVDGLSEFELTRLRHDVENVLKERILLTYLAKGKVTGEEARALFSALHDIVDEWCDGESGSDSLYAKFNNHYRIAPELYESDYRSKMEYLLKIARQEFASRLMKDL